MEKTYHPKSSFEIRRSIYLNNRDSKTKKANAVNRLNTMNKSFSVISPVKKISSYHHLETVMHIVKNHPMISSDQWMKKKEKRMTVERRSYSRICVDAGAEIIHRGRSISTRIENLSVEGVLLKTDTLIMPIGTLIDISLSLGGHQWQISGQIIWFCHQLVGIMFRISQPELYQTALDRAVSADQVSCIIPIQIPVILVS